MPKITTADGCELFYNDWGSGRPIVLIHGWPLSSDMWSDQATFLAEHGFRVITYDRRGFGRSSQPWTGYDYDTLADDLKAVMDKLELDNAIIVGFSMGGGEVARYLSRHRSARVAKAALVSSVVPYMLKTDNNPDGTDLSVFEEILSGLHQDRPHFLAGFGADFYGKGVFGTKVSSEMLQWSLQMAMMGSLRATLECAKSFALTDFRGDLAAFTMPTLIIHGTDDKTVPIDAAGRAAARGITHATLIEYEGEAHGLHATAKDRLNTDLLAFARD